ncbi:hypothetical protein Glove_262g50 [Diversispora epigaea]|uniref:Uncharacterized protein n=1 Tax=Diversispora epigaea TaxID=1348612 RepID=A0A397I7I0_9GLOM|nr:hypothetical protein Glove_262g48 [Diversispora epigaea]RHZ71111.1 hypothetical protein Glove_262g50 [Diversispora epigaea]
MERKLITEDAVGILRAFFLLGDFWHGERKLITDDAADGILGIFGMERADKVMISHHWFDGTVGHSQRAVGHVR